MRRVRQKIGLVGVLALAASMIPIMAAPAGAVSAPEVVATGLNSPYKLAESGDGNVHVAESGSGGDTCTVVVGPDGEEIEACAGATGSVTMIDGDTQSRVVTGLPSVDLAGEVIGPTAVGFDSSDLLHVLVGLGGDEATRAQLGDDRFGTLLEITDGSATVVADLVEFEETSDPDAGLPGVEEPDSNPFGLTFDDTDALVADAGGNSLLRVDASGNVELEAVFGPRFVDPPPFIPAPGQIPMQAVPTAVEVDAEGLIHVSQLTGFPFPVGEANIFSVNGNGVVAPALTGFTNIIDFDIAEDGTIYVLEFASNGLLSAEPAPALVEVRPDGTRKTLLYGDELPVPGGVLAGSDGMVYLSVCTLCGAGQGMVWMLDTSVASDPNTSAACDPDVIPGTGFTDIAPSIHREAIECAAHWGVVNGFSATTFGPTVPATRGQVASMLTRAIFASGAALPVDPPDAFPDDDGSGHEGDINALADLGVINGYADGTYRPDNPVTRAEIASLLSRSYQLIAGVGLPAGPDAFTDDDGSVHEADINAVAAAGWVNGVGGGQYAPSENADRGQFSSMIARMLSTLVSEGQATPPS
jgi:hypothetical protein